jgi:hypothetical protein
VVKKILLVKISLDLLDTVIQCHSLATPSSFLKRVNQNECQLEYWNE